MADSIAGPAVTGKGVSGADGLHRLTGGEMEHIAASKLLGSVPGYV